LRGLISKSCDDEMTTWIPVLVIFVHKFEGLWLPSCSFRGWEQEGSQEACKNRGLE
jgi:hypothetical protein